MRLEIQKLLILQDRDQQLQKQRDNLRQIPLERAAMETKLSTAKSESAGRSLELKENLVKRKQLELEIEAKRTAINRYKTQQQATRKNEEFQALSKEIEHAEIAITKLEDDELALMEAAEPLQKAIEKCEADLKAASAQAELSATDLSTKEKHISQRISELESERVKQASEIDSDHLELYTRLFAKKKDFAVVALENEICVGCHTKVSSQIGAQVRGNAEDVVQCSNCGRILYDGR